MTFLQFSSWTFFVCLGVSSISCYVCNSHNFSNTHCDDPMAPAYLPLKTHCEVPKESHVGKFPANFCVKMIGTSSKYLLVVLNIKHASKLLTGQIVGMSKT